MKPNIIQNNVHQCGLARHRRRLILTSCRNTRVAHNAQQPTVCNTPNHVYILTPSLSSLSSNAPNSTPNSTNYESLEDTSDHTIVRRRRNIILSNMKKSCEIENQEYFWGGH